MRIENSGVRYSSFTEYAAANKIVTKTSTIKDKEQRQEKFLAHHKCRGCGQPMTFLRGSNVMRCTNPSCRGIKKTRKDKDGNDVVYYVPSFDLLEEKWQEYATALFD